MKVAFYKYRRRMSYGRGPWEYVMFTDPERGEMRNFIEGLSNGYQSEQHRGFEWQKVKKPPVDWIKNKLECCQSRIQFAKQSIAILKDLL